MFRLLVASLVVASLGLHSSADASTGTANQLGHGCERYDIWIICEPTPPELSSPDVQRYAIGEAIIGSPNRERAFLVLLNADVFPRYAQVDISIPGRSATFRLLRLIPALTRDVIALDEDPIFEGRITACSIIATFERSGTATLVTRPRDLWSGETIVSGVRIKQSAEEP